MANIENLETWAAIETTLSMCDLYMSLVMLRLTKLRISILRMAVVRA